MSENLDVPVTPDYEEPEKKNNTALIIGIVVAVLLCCCCATLLTLWYTGDYIVEFLNDFAHVLPHLFLA